MQVHPYVTQVQSQLAAAAALGDDATRATADALAAAAEPAVRLAVLAAVSAAADEITAALLDSPGAPAVAVRLDGDDIRVDVRSVAPADSRTDEPVAFDDAENSARISLRLPETLKGQIEAAARADGVSVNAWLLRTAAAGIAGSGRPAGARAGGWPVSGYRMTGWING